MTEPQGRLFDDFAKLMNDAAGLAQSAGREVSSAFRAQGEKFASELDLVRREDLETVQDIATRALAEVERLAARVAELEKRLSHTEAEAAAVVEGPEGP